ncbi:P-loop containing nucleoside triphosphate hydrolase protein [Podospora australis]|uniref:P-loop containing nucleoside triphosphate hydrolase protein n=1 Tax=Podospora australis TaxID=1536484 RepID=A0AAN6WMS9_9PEZI|nr:P-loop containing nucleoside triphosphate hydrolase protein [Podospora australis]
MQTFPNRKKKREADDAANSHEDDTPPPAKRHQFESNEPTINWFEENWCEEMDWVAEAPTDPASSCAYCITPDELTSSRSESFTRRFTICYGSIVKAKAQATFLTGLLVPMQPWASFATFPIVSQNNLFVLTQFLDNETSDFAVLDLTTARYLHTLCDMKELTFTAVLSSSSLARIPRKSTRKKTIIDITVNIFGPEESATAVSNALTRGNCCLQHPVYLERFVEYKNPHYFYGGDTMLDLRHLVGPAPPDDKPIRVYREITNIFASLGEVPTDWQGDSVAEEQKLLSTVTRCLKYTKLKEHQVTGIRFIMRREHAGYYHELDNELWNLSTARNRSKLSAPCLGGILADVMGLGKTLTMLSSIVCTKEDAENHGSYGKEPGATGLQSTKATLIVLPSRQLLDVWESEIDKHFFSGTLSVRVFHGPNRVKTAETLLRHDGVQWFRVILDEAHIIRNQTTRMFKAAETLSASRRWCLTGTPIQNSLLDLRSLLRFLRYGPLAEAKTFEKYVIQPIRDQQESFRNLQLLLRTTCLRRTEQLLNLPPSTTETVPISLTSEESAAYNSILDKCKVESERQVCNNSEPKLSGLLTGTLTNLWILCNHGTYTAPNNDQYALSNSKKRSKSKGIDTTDVDNVDLCGFCSTVDESDAPDLLHGLPTCPLCGRMLATPSNTTLRPFETPTAESTPSLSSCESATGSPLEHATGHSSKLTAVVRKIEEASVEGHKSIVFTSWRTTLDLLGLMLKNEAIPFLRIDGLVNATDRIEILDQFNKTPSIQVLLLTIGSGAVGLTFTSASHVHLVEPIYNPAIESQAIARVLRIGQTRSVTIIRYITEKTLEPRIAVIQDRKRRLARISLDDKNDEEGLSLDLRSRTLGLHWIVRSDPWLVNLVDTWAARHE